MTPTSLCRQAEAHRGQVCHCGFEKMALKDWHDGLMRSDMAPKAVRHVIDLENTLVERYNKQGEEFVEQLMELHRNGKPVSIDDLTGAYSGHFGLVMDDVMEPYGLFYREIAGTGRDEARRKLGFGRQAVREFRRQAGIGDTDTALRDKLDQSFSKVKTIDKDVVERLKDKWMEQGGPNGLMRNFLLDEEEVLSTENPDLTREQLKQKLMQMWIDQRYIIERIVRTETTNTYAREMLQEWYDQGVREVERIEINDLKTCDLCKELSQPGRNVYQIEDLLNDAITNGYPVTYVSHPNCRGGYRPRVNMQAFDDFEKMIDEAAGEFSNASDVQSGASVAKDVPVEYQEQVEQALDDFGPQYGIAFVKEITDSPIWQMDRMDDLRGFYPEQEAKSRLEIERMENRGKLTQYTSRDGTVLISGGAGDINRIVVPILREHARTAWDEATADQQDWVVKRFNKKDAERNFHLEDEGVELIGETPFVTSVAGNDPGDYFIESFTVYVADPTRLLYLDPEMYDYLRANFMGGHEYINRGGVS